MAFFCDYGTFILPKKVTQTTIHSTGQKSINHQKCVLSVSGEGTLVSDCNIQDTVMLDLYKTLNENQE